MKLNIEKVLAEKNPNLNIGELLASIPSKHYKVYKIPKRTIGFRLIAQPTPKIKNIQRSIIAELAPLLKIHKSATAYIQGKSILDNARVHRASNYLLKLDLENFFNSITPDIFINSLKNQGIELSAKNSNLLIQLLFWNRSRKRNGNLVLSVGAPSSPFISNIIMYDFDKKLYQYCKSIGASYTRYADDLTFSAKEKSVLQRIPNEVKRLLFKEFSNEIRLNNSKTVFSSKAHNRHVTGITLSNNNKLSLGRDRKRYISALVHKFTLSLLDEDDILHLKGLIGLAKFIEPEFIERLESKYGNSFILNLNRYLIKD
ncbi:RNA-directed DNA polymerase [Shewanella algae]|uniref:retron St85 family RNA-directed DNA polymerase n=1 Tax=Shewanella algae TaxID=38313 RepID=UPI001AAE5303|nr:retron St85 family RNA-directed DNA polymerase [Shewanella algae]MBO2630872.1 RNA-directed DNA polymerase [Shewanella algae]